MEAYKIFDLEKRGNLWYPKTLFHGVRGSRLLPLDEWIEAEIKWGTDGSRQTPYQTGFHAYYTLDDVKKWVQGATNLDNRAAVKVVVEGCREKPKAIRPTILADRLIILRKHWRKRIPIINMV